MRAAFQLVARCICIAVIVLSNLGLASTILGCAPSYVQVAPTTATAFHEMLEADLISDARRRAHLMGHHVRGDPPAKNPGFLDEDKLPEAYTGDGKPGMWASQYHLGYAATRLIREYYAAAHPTHRRLESDELVDIVNEAGGNTYVVNAFDRDRHVDIADVENRVLFEVVPPGQTHRELGKKKVDWLLLLLNKAMLGVPTFKLGTGYSGEIGVRFAEGTAPWKLTFSSIEPGVIAYQWRTLSVEGASEASYRQAYVEHRWREPTTYEVTRFARALHEMVERLVQARETLGRSRAAAKMPMLPGQTLFDYLQTVASWSAHDDRQAQLLPVMYGPPVQVVPKKQFVGDTVVETGGGDAQGVYNLKGRPGNQPWNFHMGNSAHTLIGNRYKTLHTGNTMFTNTVSISTIVKTAGGTVALLRPEEALLRPDITDLKTNEVFEIKASSPGQLTEGQITVARNIAAINRGMSSVLVKPGTGFSGDFWARFNLRMPWWRLTWSTTAPGVIQYTWKKLNDDEVDEAKIMEGVKSGKYSWVDLTDGDMQQYAQECATFAEMYANGSQTLYQINMVSTFVVELVGHAAILYLSPGLAANANAQPRGVAQSSQSGLNVHTGKVRVGAEPNPPAQAPASAPPEPVWEPEVFPGVAPRAKM